jgi:hypothetical protein
MTICVGRRKFMAALGSVTVVWPLVARAQRPERMRRLGILVAQSENDPGRDADTAALVPGRFRPSLWRNGPHP